MNILCLCTIEAWQLRIYFIRSIIG